MVERGEGDREGERLLFCGKRRNWRPEGLRNRLTPSRGYVVSGPLLLRAMSKSVAL